MCQLVLLNHVSESCPFKELVIFLVRQLKQTLKEAHGHKPCCYSYNKFHQL